MVPQKIEWDVAENGDIVIDETKAPFDGKPVMIKLGSGWIEAYWLPAERLHAWALPGDDLDGFCWVCLDDTFQEEFDAAYEWCPLPKGSEE